LCKESNRIRRSNEVSPVGAVQRYEIVRKPADFPGRGMRRRAARRLASHARSDWFNRVIQTIPPELTHHADSGIVSSHRLLHWSAFPVVAWLNRIGTSWSAPLF